MPRILRKIDVNVFFYSTLTKIVKVTSNISIFLLFAIQKFVEINCRDQQKWSVMFCVELVKPKTLKMINLFYEKCTYELVKIKCCTIQ